MAESTQDKRMAEEIQDVTDNQDAVSGHASGARSARKVREGIVVSDKMDKTVVVAVERLKRHPLYGRVQRVTKKFQAHDEENTCKSGDRVRIMETRPLSRHKRWRILQVVERAK
jgi:small subunit ribosomal protein S17